MKKSSYNSIANMFDIKRRDFLKVSGTVGAGLLLGTPTLWAQDKKKTKPKTNVEAALKIPKTDHSLPGLFPPAFTGRQRNCTM